MTGKEMCETIVDYLKETIGEEISPEVIWNASPTGELYQVFHLYSIAMAYFEGRPGKPKRER